MRKPIQKKLAKRDHLITTDYEGLPPPRALCAPSEATFATATECCFDSTYVNSTRPASRLDHIEMVDRHYSYEDGKPNSKSSLGKVYFKLKSLPSFLLVDIDVYTMEKVKFAVGKEAKGSGRVGLQRTMVASKRFRRGALLEYLHLLIVSAQKRKVLDPSQIIFDLEARSFQLREARGRDVGRTASDALRLGRTTRLIIPVDDHAAAERVFSQFQNLELVKIKKLFSKAEKLKNPGETADKPITCAVVSRGKFIEAADANDSADKDKENLYPRYLQLFFQHQCSYNSKTHGSAYISTEEFIVGLPELERTLRKRTSSPTYTPWSHGLRFKPRVDDDSQLCIDCDLVPFILDETFIARYPRHYFLTELESSPAIGESLKKLFQGVRVTYRLAVTLRTIYKAVAKREGWKNDQIEEASDESLLRDRVYTIRDVKTNSEVGRIIRKESASKHGKTKFYSVKDYLNIMTAPFEPDYSYLPLADIGSNKPFWVPLEFLLSFGDQVPPNTRHLTRELQGLRTEVEPTMIAEKASELLKERLNTPLGETNRYFDWDDKVKSANIGLPFPALPETPYEPLKAVPKNTSDPKARVVIKSTLSPSLSVLCITSKFKDQGGERLAADVGQAFHYEHEKDANQKILDLSADKYTVALVESGPELLRLQDAGVQEPRLVGENLNDAEKLDEEKKETKEERLARNINMKAEVLLAVIDNERMSRAKYLETVAEVRRLGDRNMGAVTVCLSKKELDVQQQRHGGQQTLPLTLLHKIKFMLGETNFETTTLDDYVNKNFEDGLIIIGAHISHPGPDSTEYCPAVASLVVGRGDDLSFYRSAARTQPSIRRVWESYDAYNAKFPKNAQDAAKSEKLLKIYEPEMENLKETLTPLLRKWRDTRDRGLKEPSGKMPRVVFYRDSYHEIDGVTHENEVKQIRSAYKEVFQRPSLPAENVPLTYVTAIKNPRHHSQPTGGEASKDGLCEPMFTFTTSTFKTDGIEDDNLLELTEHVAKYQYQVHFNGARIETQDKRPTLSMLRDLTGLLNANSQSSETTSLALPVHYARKLARRVLSYYDYLSHKDMINFPPLAIRTPYGSVTSTEQLAVTRSMLARILTRPKSHGGDTFVRANRDECENAPWNEKLDEKMFFL